MSYILKATDLTVNYGEKVALDHINLEIGGGEFICLLGSNGAGKSTFINAITGLQKMSHGSIIYNEDYLSNKKQPFASLGFSAQTSVMDYYTTVWDNVILGVNLAGKMGKEANELCRAALNVLGLTSKKDMLVESLSGGQLQRVQIARAIAHKPDIYILDEPTVGLDAESSEKFLNYLKKESESGKTVIISSHDIQLLEMFSDKIIFISNGQLVYYGSLVEFINNSESEIFVKFNSDLTTDQLYWLQNYKFSVDRIDKSSCKFIVPKKTTLLTIIHDLTPLFEIKDISRQENHLRESYLNRVRGDLK